MANNLGKKAGFVFPGAEDTGYQSVVFGRAQPILNSELNLLQQLQSDSLSKAMAGLPSGWISKRDPHFVQPSGDSSFEDAFFTQDPNQTVPEIAVVAGIPVQVGGTGVTNRFVNKVKLPAGPVSGSRVDGVFLEVWRSVISEDCDGCSMPEGSGSFADLLSISVAANNVWVSARGGKLFKKSANDTTDMLTEVPISTNSDLLSVFAYDDNSVWVAGANGELFYTSNGGKIWNRLQTGTTSNLNSVVAVRGAEGFTVVAVGDFGTVVVQKPGEPFAQAETGLVQARDLMSVCFFDKNLWAVGDKGVLLRSIDGGRKWTATQQINYYSVSNSTSTTKLVSKLNKVAFTDNSTGWAVGDSGVILRSTDSGNTWSEVSFVGTEGKLSSVDYTALSVDGRYVGAIDIKLSGTASQYARGEFLSYTDSLELKAFPVDQTAPVFTHKANLRDFKTVGALQEHINALVDTSGSQVFTSNTTVASSEAAASIGQFTKDSTARISTSIGAVVWVGGTKGTLISSVDGGHSFSRQDNNSSFTMSSNQSVYSVFMDYLNSAVYVAGDVGSFLNKRGTTPYDCLSQDTDWVDLSRGADLVDDTTRVFFQGNIEALYNNHPRAGTVDSGVGIEVSSRVQVQYRIRVATGIPVESFQEAGLGSDFVFSQGPNSSQSAAGNNAFTAQGSATGDYGLWKARCFNTVDGYSYAIPMFNVARRNTSEYNYQTNTNGTASVTSARPDGIQPREIIDADIVDLRKTVWLEDIQSYFSEGKNKLLSGSLKTKITAATKVAGSSYLENWQTGSPSTGSTVQLRVDKAEFSITGSDNSFSDFKTQVTSVFQSISIGSSVFSNQSKLFTAKVLTDQGAFVDTLHGYFSLAGNTLSFEPAAIINGDGTNTSSQIRAYSSSYVDGIGEVDGNTDLLAGNKLWLTGFGVRVDSGFIKAGTQIKVSSSNEWLTISEDTEIYGGKALVTLSSPMSRTYEPGAVIEFRATSEYLPADGASYSYSISYGYMDVATASATGQGAPSSIDSAESLTVISSSGVLTNQVYQAIREDAGSKVLFKEQGLVPGYLDYATAYVGDTTLSTTQVLRGSLVVLSSFIKNDSNAATAEVRVTLEKGSRKNGMAVGGVRRVVDAETGAILPIKGLVWDTNDVNPSMVITMVNQLQPNKVLRLDFDTVHNANSTLVDGKAAWTANASRAGHNVTAAFQADIFSLTRDKVFDANGLILSSSLSARGIASFAGADNSQNPYIWEETAGVRTAVPVNVSGATSLILSDKQGNNISGSLKITALAQVDLNAVSSNGSRFSLAYRTSVPQGVNSLANAKVDLQVLSDTPSVILSTVGAGADPASAEPYALPLAGIPLPNLGSRSKLFNESGISFIDNTRLVGGTYTGSADAVGLRDGSITLINPTKTSEGKYYYSNTTEDIFFKVKDCLVDTPRGFAIALPAVVTSDTTSQVLRGEVVMVVFSSVKTGTKDNTLLIGPSSVNTAVSIYRLPGMPLLR